MHRAQSSKVPFEVSSGSQPKVISRKRGLEKGASAYCSNPSKGPRKRS
jgi:hypothetical protein